MSFGLANDGEIALTEYYFNNESFKFGIYNDNTDSISDSETPSNITTEPSGGNYARADVASSDLTVSLSSGNALVEVAQKAFDVSNSTENIDAAFLYNPADDFFMRMEISTSNYPNDYIDLDGLDNINLGGETMTLD